MKGYENQVALKTEYGPNRAENATGLFFDAFIIVSFSGQVGIAFFRLVQKKHFRKAGLFGMAHVERSQVRVYAC